MGKDRTITFAQLAREVADFAAILHAKGIRPDDRVLVFVPISIDLYRTVLAIFHCGAVAVFAEEWANRQKLNEYLTVAACKAIVAPRKLLILGALLSGAIRRIPLKVNSMAKKTGLPPISVCSRGHDDEALITFTTGITGLPKAANRTHRFLTHQLNALLPYIYDGSATLETVKPADDERDMTLLPIVLLINLAIGRTSVLANFNPRKPQTFQPADVIRQLTEHQVTSITASPYYVQQIAGQLSTQRLLPVSIRKIFCGGSSIFPAAARGIQQAFPNTEVHFIYGSTEAEPIAHITAQQLIQQHPDDLLENGLCVGTPDAAIEIAIVSLDKPLAPQLTTAEFVQQQCVVGAVGEICVKGPHVLQHYLNHAQVMKTNRYTLDTGESWHRTGDAGYLLNGQLFLAGRCKEIIHWKGNRYFPIVFENNLMQWLPHTRGTIVWVDNEPHIAIASQLPHEKVEAVLQEKFPPAASWPLVFLPDIPRDKRHFSKIDYESLRKLIRKTR